MAMSFSTISSDLLLPRKELVELLADAVCTAIGSHHIGTAIEACDKYSIRRYASTC